MSTPVDDNTIIARSQSGVGPREISNKYEVLSQVGQGGMGTVYKVRHTHLDTILALKVLQPSFLEGGDMTARFYREARVMARLKHPNIAQVLDIDRDEVLNCYYFVMEYIEGQTLRQYLREHHGLPPREVLSIAHQVASALAYAHAQTPPVIHRDIKPSNIMLEDNSKRVVVMDFGIAKELIEDSEVTRTGPIMGTMQYCAPEQIRHEQLDGGTDIYSLGMVMYEAYTGDRFFAGMTETAIIGKVLYDPQENIPNFPDATPAAFTALVTKAIAKSRQHRYQRISDFIHDLEFCQATLRESAPVVVSSSQPDSTPEFSKATTTVAPMPTAPVEEKTVFQPLRVRTQPASGPPITTKPVFLKTEEREKAPPAAPTRRVEAKKAETSYVEPTMGDAPPEIVADANQDRWAIGEPNFPERPPMREKALASPSALRRSIPWVLALVGAALVGG